MPFFQVIERADDGVVQRRAAARIDALEGRSHFREVAGEIVLGVQIVVVVEIDDEAFVLRIGGLDERKRRRIHLRPLVPHAAAIVHDQSKTDRHVLLLEDGKLLLDLIFQHAEIFLHQSGHKHAAVIEHGHMQDDQADLRLDLVRPLRHFLRGSVWRGRLLRKERWALAVAARTRPPQRTHQEPRAKK